MGGAGSGWQLCTRVWRGGQQARRLAVRTCGRWMCAGLRAGRAASAGDTAAQMRMPSQAQSSCLTAAFGNFASCPPPAPPSLQVAIVTGGDSGIGRSVALLLAKESAKAVAIVHTPKEQKVGWH